MGSEMCIRDRHPEDWRPFASTPKPGRSPGRDPFPDLGPFSERHTFHQREPAMRTDPESDLRREFDAVGAPSGLTFSPESVLRQGKRTILRRRIIAGGSAAIAVVLAVTGASLLTRPDDRAAPQPATRTATTGIVRAQARFSSGTVQVELNRDVSVESNVKYSFITLDGVRHDVGGSSTGKPGEKPDATWRSAMVEGHPVTIGLVPSPARNLEVTFAGGSPNGIVTQELKGTGYVMFAVDYALLAKEPTNAAVLNPVSYTHLTLPTNREV